MIQSIDTNDQLTELFLVMNCGYNFSFLIIY